MPPPIYLTVNYDRELQKITKVAQIPVVMSKGQLFPYLLMNLFFEYPELDQKYKPGQLGFLVNGVPPTINTVLQDGDVIHFGVRVKGSTLMDAIV